MLNSVRVRFAPSPTGHIHLGGLRAAFYNFIFARQNDGQFILRLEDTDRERIVPGSAEEIEEVLKWSGLEPDESPTKGGPYGPYIQSKRLSLYEDHAHELLTEGKAYRCFCSLARLDLLRKYQSRNRQKPHYDGKCRSLSPIEIKEKMESSGGSHVIRFALKEGETIFDDLVFGTIKNNLVRSNEGDPVIIKSDRYPTYHFANVVDDQTMKITDVIRGAEWITSTAKHIQLYQAFGWEPPRFVHFPLITMEGGVKMSKRLNHSQVREWIDQGYLPNAILNFLTNTGGGVPKEKQDLMEFWTLKQFVEGFDFKKVTCHAGSLDTNRIKIYNAKEIKQLWAEDSDHVMNEILKLLKKNQIECDMDFEFAKRIVNNLIERLVTFNDLINKDHIFIWRRPNLSNLGSEFSGIAWDPTQVLKETINTIQKIELSDREKFKNALIDVVGNHKIEYAEYMKFIRKVLTNRNKGPPIFEIVQCLGKPRTLCYLENALEYIDKPIGA